MKVRVCLVCLNAIDSSLLQETENDDGEEKSGHVPVPLLTRFLKFVNNYLNVSTVASKQWFEFNDENAEEGGSFCEKCELAVINPICQVYLELVSNQLRLSWELGKLGKFFESSHHSTSEQVKRMNMKLLANQLGVDNVTDVERFRSLLTEKCK